MKKKLGFTFVEISIVLLIIAILIAVGFITIKPEKSINNAKAKYRYANAYETLNTAIYEMTSKDETNPFKNENHFRSLCTGLASWINTEETNCTISLDESATFLTDENLDFRTLTPNLVTQNGMKYYFSSIIVDNREKESRSYYDPANPYFDIKFFMVYVDINADINTENNKTPPHTVVYDSTEEKIPDVFAFALIPEGSAIPMGLAEYNMRYLQTKILYRENHRDHYTQNNYTYREAKHFAWGWYSEGGGGESFRQHTPFTWNDYIREILESKETQLYNFLAAGTFRQTYASNMYEKCAPQGEKTPYDLCRVVVEKNPIDAVGIY